ncbi:MAG TPA: glycoside hydrolase family 66 protein [Bacillales bacterium]
MSKKRLMFLVKLSAVLLIVMSFLPMHSSVKAAGSNNVSIGDVYTGKARYNPSDSVTITVELENQNSFSWSGDVNLNISHLETSVYSEAKNVSLSPGQSKAVNFTWTTPNTDFQGYFVEVTAGSSKGYTAVDVSSDWTRYPRYGFLSEFAPNETLQESQNKVNKLSRDYHINAWQFYDWMWRHDKFIKRSNGQIDSTWMDLFNRTISWKTIENQIDAVHNVNGNAMAYAMGYAARENYDQFGIQPEWGIYKDSQAITQFNVDFHNGKYLFLFDPQNQDWQNYILPEYLDAVNSAGFDGIHVDQMGQRNNVYDYYGNPIDLAERFSPFLNKAKSQLTSNNSNKDFITFNIVDGTVDGWAEKAVAKNANVDFLYSEIWFKSNNYIDLKNYIEQLRDLSNNKEVVLAAYMNYKENTGPHYEAEDAALVNVAVDTDHLNYTGTGFVDQFAEQGDKVTFTINAVEDGEYALVWRFANRTGSNATRNLYIDGEMVTTVNFAHFSSWDTWSHDNYNNVKLDKGMHEITLSYDSGNTGAINLDSLTLGTFDKDSVLLTDAAISASGATHIELGGNNRMLAHEYYPNTSKVMRNGLKEGLQDHYNFITAYENLLFDKNVIPNDSGNQFINIAGEATSGDAGADTIWTIFKRNDDYDIFHLINLTNNDTKWRNEAASPTIKTNLSTKIYIGGHETISDVYLASPDIKGGKTQELSFTTGSDTNGKYVSFTVPSLEYWDMVYMKRSFSTPQDNIYEAEDEVLSNVAVDMDHAGYTGTGFVDQFAETNDGVSFTVKASTDGDYALRFHYGNGGSDASRDVYVDGEYAGTVQFDNTGSWDTWDYGELTVHLTPGYHSIVLWYNGSNTGAINLDHLDLDKTYIWQFDRQINTVPAGYRITFRVGQDGWVHWGKNGWNNVKDSGFVSNGSNDASLGYETSIGPFSAGTTVDFTFLWDDNQNDIKEYDVDRWEGQDYHISVE